MNKTINDDMSIQQVVNIFRSQGWILSYDRYEKRYEFRGNTGQYSFIIKDENKNVFLMVHRGYDRFDFLKPSECNNGIVSCRTGLTI